MVVFHYESFSTTVVVPFNLHAYMMLINKLCEISCLHWKIRRSHMRIQLSSSSWNLRATLGLNCHMTTTGWAQAGTPSEGRFSPCCQSSAHCPLPAPFPKAYELETSYNIISRFYHIEMIESVLIYDIYFVIEVLDFLKVTLFP